MLRTLALTALLTAALSGCSDTAETQAPAEATPDALAHIAPEITEAPIVNLPSPTVMAPLSGVITDATGAVQPEVTITLLPHTIHLAGIEAAPDSLPSSATNAEGLYEFATLDEGRWWPQLAWNEMTLTLSAPLHLREGWSIDQFDLPLPATGERNGRVTTLAGEAIADAQVSLSAVTGLGIFTADTRADDAGHFSLPVPVNVISSSLTVQADGFAPSVTPAWNAGDRSSTLDRAVALTQGARIEGFLFGQGDTPLADAMVWVTSEKLPDDFTLSTRTDEQGFYALEGLPDGALEMHATAPGLRQEDPLQIFALSDASVTLPPTSLRSAAPAAGQILDAQGQPISGALVIAQSQQGIRLPFFRGRPWHRGLSTDWQPTGWARTDDNGEFLLAGLVRGQSVSFVVVSPSDPPQRFQDIEPNGEISLSLAPGATATGTVLSAITEEPLALARVTVVDPESGIRETTLTDSLGRFRTHFLTTDAARLNAVADNHALASIDQMPLNTTHPLEDLRVILERGVTVAGRVIDARSENILVGATVTMRNDGTMLEAATDDQGRFVIEHVAAGGWIVQASADLHLDSDRLSLRVLDEDLMHCALSLEPAARVSGRVVNLSERGIAGATVGISPLGRRGRFGGFGGGRGGPGDDFNPGALLQSVTTDDDGYFTIDKINPDRDFSLAARHPSHAQGSSDSLRLEAGAIHEGVVIALMQGGTIRGRVIDERELPIVDAQVMQGIERGGGRGGGRGGFGRSGPGAVLMGGFVQGDNEQRTDDSGRFRFEHLMPGNYTVLARTEEHPYQTEVNIEVTEGGQSDEIILTLTPGATLTGSVIDSEGNAIPDAEVSLRTQDRERPNFANTTTSGIGSFEFRGLDARSHTLVAEADGFDRTTLEAQAPSENTVITLERAGILKGIVLDVDSEIPLPKFTVTAEREGRRWGGSQTVEEEFTSSTGEFMLEGLVAGTWEVTITAPIHAPLERAGIEMQNDTTTETEPFLLQLGRTIQGRVVEESDPTVPIPGAMVQIAEEAESGWGGGWGGGRGGGGPPWFNEDSKEMRVTDADGRFFITNLVPGTHTVIAQATGYLENQAEGEAPEEGESEELVIALRKGGGIIGRVLESASRLPIQGARISLPDEGYLDDLAGRLVSNGVTSDDQGFFEMPRVPAGNFSLRVLHDTYAELVTDPITVREGEVTDVGNLMVSAGGMIYGYVFDAEGNFLEGAFISSSGPGGNERTRANQFGEFTFNNLPEGRYRLTMTESSEVWRGGSGTQLSQTVTVTDGEETEVIFAREPGYTLTGQVTDNGEPAPNVQVRLTRTSGTETQGESGTGTSNDSGRYEIENLTPGEYNVAVNEMQGRRRSVPMGTDRLTISGDRTFNIQIPQSSISGTVRDSMGNPIDGADVAVDNGIGDAADWIESGSMGRKNDQTDSEGRYTIENIDGESVTLVVQRRNSEFGSVPRSVTLDIGENKTGIDFVLPEEGRLVGLALDDDNGQPITAGLYFMLNDSNGISVRTGDVTPSADGSYVIDRLSEGDYTLSVFAAKYAPIYNLAVKIEESSDTDKPLDFHRGGTIRVTVENQDDPVMGAVITFFDANGDELILPPNSDGAARLLASTTNEDGFADPENIPEGPVSVKVTHGTDSTIPIQISVDDHGVHELPIEMVIREN